MAVTKRQMWAGFIEGKLCIYGLPEYYDGVMHADLFTSRRAARRCYEDVRPVVIAEYPKSKLRFRRK